MRRRRVRLLLFLVVALVVGGAAAGLLVVRPHLSSARDRVDARWEALRPALDDRYAALRVVDQALKDAGAGNRAVTKTLAATLDHWDVLKNQGSKHTDAGDGASTANDLEALARRARANVAGSDRLLASQPVKDAFTAFDQKLPPPPVVAAYNGAARKYQDSRSGFFEGIVAKILGYDSRPTLLLG